MSHITKIEAVEIWDLITFRRMCVRMGWKVKKQSTFKSYKTETCDLAVDVGAEYEVGLIKKEDGQVDVFWDRWATGGLRSILGENGGILKQQYDVTSVINNAENNLRDFVVGDMKDDDHVGWKEVVVNY